MFRARFLVALLALVALSASACQPRRSAAGVSAGSVVHQMRFPVDGPVHFFDDFGACRGTNCSRRHQGNDLMGVKLEHLVAAADGTVTYLRLDGAGRAGNSLAITDAAGWEYWYLHINNDSPGTDDGTNPAAWLLGPGVAKGSHVRAGQLVAYMGDSGDAEQAGAHLHFELHRPDGVAVDPYTSLRAVQPPGAHESLLKAGVTGPVVGAWQGDLNRVGAHLPITGVFGPSTEAMTKAFQHHVHLLEDGIVGPGTWYAMRHVLGS